MKTYTRDQFYKELNKYLRWNPEHKYIRDGKVMTDSSGGAEAEIHRDYEGLLKWMKKEFKEHGEFFTKDSIRYIDSLRFETSGGRTVYGGGGITPDHFVAYDTTNHTDYYNRLLGTNSLQDFALNYIRKNYDDLNEMEFSEFFNTWTIDDAGMDQIVDIGYLNDVSFNTREFAASKELINLQVKAMIARSVWGDEAFYRIYKNSDNIFLEALKLFDQAEKLAFAQ